MKCPYCKKESPWVENKAIYGRNYGASYMCYYCKGCDAYVGCHQNSHKALGTMANKELRNWRMKVHAVIDPLWKSKEYSRGMVYARLNDYFGGSVHIGESGVERCQEIIKSVPVLFNLKSSTRGTERTNP